MFVYMFVQLIMARINYKISEILTINTIYTLVYLSTEMSLTKSAEIFNVRLPASVQRPLTIYIKRMDAILPHSLILPYSLYLHFHEFVQFSFILGLLITYF